MCDGAIAQIINALEAGAYPQPLFYSFPSCGRSYWPIDPSQLPLDSYATEIQASEICPSTSVSQCPVPVVSTLITPPNLKITFFANDIDDETKTSAPITDRIMEIGELAIFSAPTGIVDMLTAIAETPVIWSSRECGGLENGCTVSGLPQNCNHDTQTPFDTTPGPNFGKLLHSMISCNSPILPSFLGVNVDRFLQIVVSPESNYETCQISPAEPDYPSLGPAPTAVTDMCKQNNIPLIETKVYQSVWDQDSGSVNCPPDAKSFPGACSCIANELEALENNIPKFRKTGTSEQCSPIGCGACTVEQPDAKTPLTTDLTCTCNGRPILRKSVKAIRVDFVDNEQNVINWDQLQVLWCTNGLTFNGVPIQRYTSGSPACDEIMTQACMKTNLLTNSPELLISCGCILEKQRLASQFAGLDLPSQCFTSQCNITNTNVYRTRDQIEGCSARLCQQALTLHGSEILYSGIQELLCAGEVFSVQDFVTTSATVPFVSQASSTPEAVPLGSTFYIAIVALVIVIVLVVVWVLRTVRMAQARKKAQEASVLARLSSRA